MRPIDADAIPYTMLYKENWMGCTGIEKSGVWKDTIDSMPTIKPEIIRCEDCKHYEADIMGNPWGVCCHPNWIIDNCGSTVDENGWCYRAENKWEEE